MFISSWHQWLRTVRNVTTGSKRRLAKLPRVARVEGLEDRALLTAPVAVNDSGYVVNEDATLNGTTVLANDTDVDTDIASAALDVGPTHAANFTFNADGTFTYTPVANFHGTDTFTYHAIDSTPESSNIATVTITVQQLNESYCQLLCSENSGSGGKL